MKLLVLIGVTAACWAVAAGVAAAVDGPGHWLPSGVAVLICLLPAIGTLLAAGVTERQTPVVSIGFVLIAPIIRLLVVLVLGGLVGVAVPALRAEPAKFVFWAAGFYLVSLAVETAVLLAKPKPAPKVPADM